MPAVNAEPATEHHPACKSRCVRECDASPRRAPPADGPRVRTYHTSAVMPLERAPRALWEGFDEPEAVRRSGCAIPLPETYTGHERAAERYSLDRWTQADGIEDRALDAAIIAATEGRRISRRARDVADIAYALRAAFPGVARTKTDAGRARDLFMLAIGGDISDALPKDLGTRKNWESVCAQGGIYVGLVWGLALILFGRNRDTVSEYALGRMLPGEPLRDTRAPFANAGHVLAVSHHALPGLGGGSCAWPQEDPRMRRRTFAKGGEMKVSNAHHGSDTIRGEQGVHRILDARNVARRAGLSTCERAMVAALNDRSLTREEKTLHLRAAVAREQGSTFTDAATLQEATSDTTDGDLYRKAKAAAARAQVATERESVMGDTLAPKREKKSRSRVQGRRYEGADAA